MPFRHIDFEREHFYHIYNRGNNRQPIFFEPRNYQFFLQLFSKYFPPKDIELHAYCLLPNHFHFLVRIISQINFSRGMQYYGISYAKSINKAYHRVGHLFQGRFGAKHVGSVEYLLHLSRYIHVNPVLAGCAESAEDWEYSSYVEYLGIDRRTVFNTSRESFGGAWPRLFVTTESILSFFQSRADYKSFVESYAEKNMREFETELWNRPHHDLPIVPA